MMRGKVAACAHLHLQIMSFIMAFIYNLSAETMPVVIHASAILLYTKLIL